MHNKSLWLSEKIILTYTQSLVFDLH